MSVLPPPDYTVNEQGERIIAASRRPDGTVRKERRVRAGYVPQDEQQVYVSRGTAFKQNAPKCPGFDESSAEPAKPKTKSAAKNAKRKEKRLAEQGAAGSAADSAAAAVQAMSLGGGGGSSGAAQAPAAGAAGGAAAGAEEAPSVEKQIRTLKKKMRQAEALAEKRAGGAALSLEEEAKLGKLAGWQEELRQLEAQL